jgi:hypothetical protein
MRDRLTGQFDRIKNAAGAGTHRQISEDFKYNKAKIKHLKHILHNVTVALGTLTSAHNEFSKVKGPDISPDGLLGGLGYIIPIKDIKESLITAIKNVGDVADCIADELTNPKWEVQDDKDVKKLIKEKKEVEEQVDEEMSEGGESAEEEEIKPDDVITSESDKASKGDDLDLSYLDANKEAAFNRAVKATLIRFGNKQP